MTTNYMAKQIKSIQELKDSKNHDYFIALNGGVRSSKNIRWIEEDKVFSILNEIDDTMQELTEEEVYNVRSELTNIGKALEYGALYQY